LKEAFNKKKGLLDERIILAQKRSIECFKLGIEKKAEDLKKHDKMLYQKALDGHIQHNLGFFLKFHNFWKSLIILLKICEFLKEKNKIFKRKRFLNVYYRLTIYAVLKKALKIVRKNGENPKKRLLFDGKMMILYHFAFKKNGFKKKSKKIFVEVLKQGTKIILLNEKMEKYLKNVKRIQRKWKLLKTRKLIYKATIRNIWNKNVVTFYYLLKKEKQGKLKEELGINQGLLFNNMITGNIRSRKNEDAFMKIDPYIFFLWVCWFFYNNFYSFSKKVLFKKFDVGNFKVGLLIISCLRI